MKHSKRLPVSTLLLNLVHVVECLRLSKRPLTYYLTDKPQETNRTFDTAVSTSVLYLIEDIPQHAQDLKDVSGRSPFKVSAFSKDKRAKSIPTPSLNGVVSYKRDK
jgi:hypothetical protein